MRLSVVAVQGGDQSFDAAPATLFERLVNGRQSGIGGDLEVVEPDDGAIVGEQYDASQRRAEITREMVWHQETPDGTVAVAFPEAG